MYSYSFYFDLSPNTNIKSIIHFISFTWQYYSCLWSLRSCWTGTVSKPSEESFSQNENMLMVSRLTTPLSLEQSTCHRKVVDLLYVCIPRIKWEHVMCHFQDCQIQILENRSFSWKIRRKTRRLSRSFLRKSKDSRPHKRL